MRHSCGFSYTYSTFLELWTPVLVSLSRKNISNLFPPVHQKYYSYTNSSGYPYIITNTAAQPLLLTTAAVIICLTRPQCHSPLSILLLSPTGRRLRLPLFDKLPRHGQERLLDILRRLRARFQERNAKIVSEFLRLLSRNRPVRRPIAFVANEQLARALGGVAVYLLKPIVDVIEGVRGGRVVDHDDAVRSSVVRRCDRSESLLPSGLHDCYANHFR
jgi:hypothetical protein